MAADLASPTTSRVGAPAARGGRLWLAATLGGTLLALASDQLRDPGAGRLVFGLFAGAVMAHFVVDAGLWRMREAFPRAFLSGRLPFLFPAGRMRR